MKIWNLNRCEGLHFLSKYGVYLMDNGLFIDTGEMSREHSIHMLVNMMFLQETTRRYVNVLQ